MTLRRALLVAGAFVLALSSVQTSAQSPASETELLQRIAGQPAEIGSYLDLAKLYTQARRFDDAEQMLTQALAIIRRARVQPIPPQGVAMANPNPATGSRMLLPVAPLRVGGDIKEPRKIKDVKPVYPAEAQAARVSGIVILEAIIDTQGYVRDARVLRSVALLDQAAVDAVLQWQFTPTLLNGAPVEIVMTVTVNFSLDR